MDWRIMKFRLLAAEGYAELGMHKEAVIELQGVPGALKNGRQFLESAINVYRLSEDWANCRQLAHQLVSVDPMNVQGYVISAYATRRIDNIEAARSILRKAEKLHPDAAIIKFNLGCYAAQMGEQEAALRYVEKAIELDETYRHVAEHDPDLDPVREELILKVLDAG